MYAIRSYYGSTAYAGEIAAYPGQFDILVIDGRDRVNCIKNGIGALRPGGVVIWDNSDREEYRSGYDLLTAAGFGRLDFRITSYNVCYTKLLRKSSATSSS